MKMPTLPSYYGSDSCSQANYSRVAYTLSSPSNPTGPPSRVAGWLEGHLQVSEVVKHASLVD
jgi:hypothetical protein